MIDYANLVNPPVVNDSSDPLSSALLSTQVQASDPMASFLDGLSPSLLQDSTVPTSHTMQLQLHQQPTLSPTLPLLGPTLVQRPRPENGRQKTAGFILHTLKSFPQMMLRHNTLPPFIHPRLMTPPSIADREDELEPLHNCISLLHMLRGRVAGSRKLFWRNVRMECERFLQEVCDEVEFAVAMSGRDIGSGANGQSSIPPGTDGDCLLLSKRYASTSFSGWMKA
jgi:hypothetical protein